VGNVPFVAFEIDQMGVYVGVQYFFVAPRVCSIVKVKIYALNVGHFPDSSENLNDKKKNSEEATL
jgi:hypothetical protein